MFFYCSTQSGYIWLFMLCTSRRHRRHHHHHHLLNKSLIAIDLRFLSQYILVFDLLLMKYHARVPEKDFVKAFKSNPRLRTKLNYFQRQMSSTNSDDEFVAIRPEWTTVDRIVARRYNPINKYIQILNCASSAVMRCSSTRPTAWEGLIGF